MRLFGLIASLFGAGSLPSAQASPTPARGADVMRDLRTMMLKTQASEAGIQPSKNCPKVFGIVMDMSVSGGHTATVVSMCDGNASLYTTSEFGILGGIGSESVRSASTNFVAEAQSHFDAATPAKDFPYPSSGHVRIYLLGFNGVRVIDSETAEIVKPASAHSSLWIAGQHVLTELRLLSEKSKKKQ